MLPYPTDRRRLLMMVRVFVHEFTELLRAHSNGWPYPSDPCDETADHQLEEFLERIAVDASQVDEVAQRRESETEIQRALEKQLNELLLQAAWNRNRIQWN
ncbi:MAG TPA: hypothetical protein VF384_15115 [Planctomycetota bacterium]